MKYESCFKNVYVVNLRCNKRVLVVAEIVVENVLYETCGVCTVILKYFVLSLRFFIPIEKFGYSRYASL